MMEKLDRDHAPATAQAPPECPNCGSARIASFCADCGQDQESPRKKWRAHIEEIVSTYTELDSATLKTLGLTVAQPGKLSELTLQNRSGDLVSPLKLFLIVIVLYSIFFAFSPIKYGQLYLAMDREWYGADMIAPGEELLWTYDVQVYAPAVQDPVSPGFRKALSEGSINLETIEPGWIAGLVQAPERMARVNDRFATFLIYLPLAVIPALMILNGFLFRRRYWLFDHFFLALETATGMILIVMFTASVTALLYMAGITLDEATPLFLIEMPLTLIYLVCSVRRFYRLRGWTAFGNALAVYVLFLTFQQILFYQTIALMGRYA